MRIYKVEWESSSSLPSHAQDKRDNVTLILGLLHSDVPGSPDTKLHNSVEYTTYAMLVVREAIQHGGQGWPDYGRLFHQQA